MTLSDAGIHKKIDILVAERQKLMKYKTPAKLGDFQTRMKMLFVVTDKVPEIEKEFYMDQQTERLLDEEHGAAPWTTSTESCVHVTPGGVAAFILSSYNKDRDIEDVVTRKKIRCQRESGRSDHMKKLFGTSAGGIYFDGRDDYTLQKTALGSTSLIKESTLEMYTLGSRCQSREQGRTSLQP